jgi:hypothetical protein
MSRILRVVALCLAVTTVAGCVYYEPVAVGPSPQQRFDRSWSAALGAMVDQGVAIETQDRGAGVIRGSRGGIALTAMLQTQADGSIQVRFDQSGATSTDPGLIHRVSESYERRMGR